MGNPAARAHEVMVSTAWILVVIALWAAVLYALLVAAGVSRRLAELQGGPAGLMQSQLDAVAAGPRIGEPLPEVPGHLELSSGGESGRIVLFVSSSCGPCLRLRESLMAAQAERNPALSGVDLVVVTDAGGVDRFSSVASAVVVQEGEISTRLGVRVTPFAIAMHAGSVVGVNLPQSAADVATLAAKCRPVNSGPLSLL